jgi:hypothetical protein
VGPGSGLSVTQSGAITTPNGRLATTQGTARFDLTTQSRYRVAPHDWSAPLTSRLHGRGRFTSRKCLIRAEYIRQRKFALAIGTTVELG